MAERIGLRLQALLLFAALGSAGLGALVLALWQGYRRLDLPEALPGFVQAAVLGGFAILGLMVGAWYLFDSRVARPAAALAGALRARAHADVAGAPEISPALGELGPAAAAISDTLAQTRGALAQSVARETARLSEEKARLEALLADVPVGVLLCSAEHQLVFYNGQAVDLLGGGQAPGLDRNIFGYLREGPLRHAHQRLTEGGDPDAAADLLCATASDARVLAGRMRLLPQGGYVLTLRDVTSDLAAHARREQLLSEIFDRVRRPAANLHTAIGVLAEAGDSAPALGPALLQEVAALTAAITELGRRHDEGRADWWPLAQTRSADLLDGIRARLEGAGLGVEVCGNGLILRCDGFQLVALWSALALRLAEAGHARSFRLTIEEEDGPGAVMELGWEGPPLPVGRLEQWLDAPLEVGLADVTGRSVLLAHGTEAWPEPLGNGRSAIRMPIREARRAGRRPAPATRAVVYDFDLLSRAVTERLAETRLADLTCVVFDTETTGLDPARDEIVQIAGVRLVNGRRVAGEVFETLVNPGRRIPPSSTHVHGITDAMVVGAPDVVEAGRRFHSFAEGAVLVAHNAPFDLHFLRRHEDTIGLRFDNPVLDTVLLSAVIFGRGESHSLDALTARLGITIPEEARHTARGDAEATAEAFLRLIPMLQARGLATFGEVLAEVRRHGRLLRDLNEELA